MNTTLIPKKYLTATLTLLILGLAALQAAMIDGLTIVEGLQVLALVVGGIVTYYSPLLSGSWPAALKVLGAVIGALLVAVIGVFESAITGSPIWTPDSVILVVLAVLNALAAQIGTDQRIDSAAEAIAAPEISNVQIDSVDPKAASLVP